MARRAPVTAGAGDPHARLADLGQTAASIAQRAIERMDAMLSESDDDGRPAAFNRVAGVIVTGSEDSAHHVVNNLSGALNEFGYKIPGQAWTYCNRGPGPGPATGGARRDGPGRKAQAGRWPPTW